MQIRGKNDNSLNECTVILVLFNGAFPSNDFQFFELSEDNTVAELYTWEELEKWLKDNPESDDEDLHLSLAIDPCWFANPHLYDTDNDYTSIIEIKDIRSINLTDNLKSELEEKVFESLVKYEQFVRGIPMTKGRLERIKIKKLFHKYDVDIDLSNPVNILIGANGIGKTTIIRILDNYYNMNYIDVLAAPFEAIEYTYIEDAEDLFELTEGGLIKINYDYNDFFPEKSKVVESFREQYSTHVYSQQTSFAEKENDEQRIQRAVDRFDKMIDELDQMGVYGQFLYCFYKKKGYTTRITNAIEKWFKIDFIERFSIIKRCDLLNNIDVFKGTKLENLFFDDRTRVIGDEPSPNELAVYYVDFVQPISLENRSITDSGFHKANLDWIMGNDHSEFNASCGDDKISVFSPGQGRMQIDLKSVFHSSTFRGSPLHEARNHFTGFLREHTDFLKEIVFEEFSEKNTSINYFFSENGSLHDMSDLDEMVNNRIFKINDVIHKNYYPEKFILDINNRALVRVKEYFELLEKGAGSESYNDFVDEYHKIVSQIKTNFYTDYYEYVHPILVQNSFYCIDMKKLTDPNRVDPYTKINDNWQDEEIKDKIDKLYEEVVYLRTFVGYLNEIVPMLKDDSNKTSKIITYERILKKYLIGKLISITPSGIKIRDSVTNKDGKNTLILYDSDEIDLSIVSSGEKKILVLFALQVFYSECMFLLDEPELSLSILWQESLVPDLITCGSNKFVIATHSPYIAKDESVRDYIKYLPQED